MFFFNFSIFCVVVLCEFAVCDMCRWKRGVKAALNTTKTTSNTSTWRTLFRCLCSCFCLFVETKIRWLSRNRKLSPLGSRNFALQFFFPGVCVSHVNMSQYGHPKQHIPPAIWKLLDLISLKLSDFPWLSTHGLDMAGLPIASDGKRLFFFILWGDLWFPLEGQVYVRQVRQHQSHFDVHRDTWVFWPPKSNDLSSFSTLN